MTNEELVTLIKQGIDTKGNMEQLYIQNKGMIYTVVKKYRYACQADYDSTPIIEEDELMHEAYFGLVKAVENYDASQGVLFMSYAAFWIRQAVKRFLDDSGRVIRVPVHRQAEIYRYNQITAYFLQNFNRLPLTQEYARWLHISEKAVEQLQQFMSRGKVRSLDYVMSGTENEDITVADSVASDVDIESDIVEKVSHEQLRDELWDLINQVLKDEKKVLLLKYIYEGDLSLREIGRKLNANSTAIDEMMKHSIRLLSRNESIRRLAVDTGLWNENNAFSAELVKHWCDSGLYNCMDKRELRYARHMGWVDKERL